MSRPHASLLLFAAVLLVSSLACGQGAPPRNAPRPYTVAQLRAASVVGRTYRFRVEAMQRGVRIKHMTWTAVTADRCTIEGRETTEDGKTILTPAKASSSTWSELLEHSTFPAVLTTVTREDVSVPAGTFPTILYTVTEKQAALTVTKKAWFAVDLPGPPVKMVISAGGEKPVFDMVLLHHALTCPTTTVHFAEDSSVISKPEAASLANAAVCLRARLASARGTVRLGAHTAAGGTPSYALALASRLGRAAQKVLVAAGVPRARTSIRSYGLERPLCKEDSAPCRAKNRRVEITVE